MTCKNCSAEVTQNYCPHCGQPARLKRIDGHYIQHEIEHVLHFEKGIFYTVKELLIRPGENVRTFMSENRSRLVKPVIFIIICSLIYSVISHYFHLEDGYINYMEEAKSTTGALFAWAQSHYGYANIILGVFIAFWLKLFFRKSNYNFFEILILLCFVIGVAMLMYSAFGVLQGLTKMDLMQYGGMISFVYSSWAIGQFFNQNKIGGILKSAAAYLLGMLTFVLVIIAVGQLIDRF